jgi:hypothetical protein
MDRVRQYLRDKYWDDPNRVNGPEEKHKRNFRADRPWGMPMSKVREPEPFAGADGGIELV